MVDGLRRIQGWRWLPFLALLLAGCGGPAVEATSGIGYLPTRTDLAPRGQTASGLVVERVVDGDTLHVRMNGDDVTVRLIGIDTPETVKPGSPVDCFGPEASDFAKGLLSGQKVTVEFDATQGMTDRYGRTLAYVWLELPGGALSLFNLDAVAGGYARERQYGTTPYAWQETLASAQDAARADDVGLWAACPP